jgi:hypothetical protein
MMIPRAPLIYPAQKSDVIIRLCRKNVPLLEAWKIPGFGGVGHVGPRHFGVVA